MKDREDCSRCFNRQPTGCWLCGGTGKEPLTDVLEVAQRDMRPGDMQVSTRGLLTVTEVELGEIRLINNEMQTVVWVRYNGEHPEHVANLAPTTKVQVMRFREENDAKRAVRFFTESYAAVQ